MRKFIICLISIFSLYASYITAASYGDPSQLIINEIQVANIDCFIDPSYNYGGWVEFYNPTDSAIRLSGLYISDDVSNLKRYRISSSIGSIQAHRFKVIWFDHYDTGSKYSANAYRQVDFKLNYDGGTLYISDSNGNLLFSQTYPPAIQRCSYARIVDGGDEWSYCSTPTPEDNNDGSDFADTQLAAPIVDVDSRSFKTSFSIHVTVPEGATLYYTTDGSTPTRENGIKKTSGTFIVSRSTKIFRFRAFKNGFLPSAVVTRTYVYQDKNYYLPIVSVVTDSLNLYDNKIGAYTIDTNGISGQGVSYATNKNRSWERPVNFEYLVPEKSDGGSFLMAINQECDFEVCGGWSRNQYAPNASFRLKSGKYYLGQNYLPYAFFKHKPYVKNKAIVIRNGGNDGYARLRDAATHQILLRSGLYVDCQDCQPVHVFINGVFKFTFNLREPNNKNHGYSNYGIDTDEMDQFEINGSVGYEQKTGDDTVFRQWMSLAQQLSRNPNNSLLYDTICELVDIDEYTNYMAAECYIGSTDWLTNSNNVKGYRSRNDGKFHLICMDLDSGFGSSSMLNSLAGRRSDSRYDTGKNFLIDIFLNMLQYEPFKKRFIDAYCLVNGSVFENERCRQIITEMKDEKYEAIEFEKNGSTLNSTADWLINTISSGHSARMSTLQNYFGLQKPITMELSSNVQGATILANNQEIPSGYFNGSFYAPMILKAQAPAGYRFVEWKQTGSGVVTQNNNVFGINDKWYYYDQGSLDGQEWTVRAYSTADWKRGEAPFGYGKVGIDGTEDYRTTLDYGGDADNKYPTYYFRKSFQLSEVPSFEDQYVLKGYVDDGCVVYINGHEVGRYLMPQGDITYNTFSTAYAGDAAGQFEFMLDHQWLQKGTNIITVEVHNTHAGSSDIYWTAELQHDVTGGEQLLTKEPELDLSQYAGMNLSKVVATYEPLPEAERQDSLAMPLRLNEVSAANSIFINDWFKKNDWLELYNPTDNDLNAAGLYISDNLKNPKKYQVPVSATANTIVPAHGYLVIWADNLESLTQLHVPFKLGNKNGEALYISSSEEFVQNNASFFDAHPSLKEFSDGFVYNAHGGDQSVGRYPDGSNDFYCFAIPTIGRQNSLLTMDYYLGKDTGIGTKIDPIPEDIEELEDSMMAYSSVGYYNLNGIFLGRDARHLRTGMYVVRKADGTTHKVLIRK